MLSFHQFNEAAYKGNIGIMELVHFHRKATPEQKKQLQSHINQNKHKEAWSLVQSVTGVKLHKSVSEDKNIKPDILPQAGAGQWGTDKLKNNYLKGTPGQGFNLYKKHTN
jgi:hypothetical protein